mmetsp:Transcript_136930/g.381736  ORF Transcript_136930/g.381736 Transcript_136930/m.381736 type:complete len:216 (+) Transcript_136930:98-745(+)
MHARAPELSQPPASAQRPVHERRPAQTGARHGERGAVKSAEMSARGPHLQGGPEARRPGGDLRIAGGRPKGEEPYEEVEAVDGVQTHEHHAHDLGDTVPVVNDHGDQEGQGEGEDEDVPLHGEELTLEDKSSGDRAPQEPRHTQAYQDVEHASPQAIGDGHDAFALLSDGDRVEEVRDGAANCQEGQAHHCRRHSQDLSCTNRAVHCRVCAHRDA